MVIYAKYPFLGFVPFREGDFSSPPILSFKYFFSLLYFLTIICILGYTIHSSQVR